MQMGLTVRERWYALSRGQQLLLGAGSLALFAFLFWNRKQVASTVKSTATAVARSAGAIMQDAYNAVNTLAGQAAWAKMFYDAVSKELPQLSTGAKLLIVAHGGYESGWGTGKTVRRGNNNVFNVTAGSAWKGARDFAQDADTSYSAPDCQRQGRPMNKVDKQGRPYCTIDQTWRKYATVNEAIRDYWDFLGPNQNRGRYVAARAALERGDVASFGNELFKAGYFTYPVASYVKEMQQKLDLVKQFLGS